MSTGAEVGQDETLLKEIRDRFDYCYREWQDVYDAGDEDMRYVAGDPWPAEEKRARNIEGNERPCLTFDELNQHVNREINNWRANQRSIKVNPRGAGANDQTAELRQGKIRDIEYESKATTAYTTAFENVLQRSFGFLRLKTCFCRPNSFDQELRIEAVPNPRSCYIDPDSKEADGSDALYAFELDEYSEAEFKRKWPKAEIQSFSTELQARFPRWIKDNRIQVAKYWYIETTKRKLLAIEGFKRPLFQDELPEGSKIKKGALVLADGTEIPILKQRDVEDRRVYGCVTNGIEILEKSEWGGWVDHADGTRQWHGKWIPLFPMWGKELYVASGGGPSQRKVMSLVRLARDAQMFYNYCQSAAAEVIGMSPKTPFIGYEGQFDTQSPWADANRIPTAYLEAKATIEDAPGRVLPLPQRQTFEPPIQAIILAANTARTAIQNAMGSFVGSPDRRDTHVRSGVALEKLEQATAQGNFHFVDNADRTLEHLGRAIDDVLPVYYDTVREEAIRQPDDSVELIRLNDPAAVDPQTGAPIVNSFSQGDHGVTISTGPSYQSQREEASEFADTFAANPALFQAAIAGNKTASKIMSLAVKLKNGGPIMEEIADAFDPGEEAEIPPQVQQAMQQLQMQLQAINARAIELEKENEQLKSGALTKQAEIESRERIAQMQDATKQQIADAQNEVKLIIAQLQARVDEIEAERQRDIELLKIKAEAQRSREQAEHADAQQDKQLLAAERQGQNGK